MSSLFTHLHVHSCYSLLEALPSPAELAQAACQAGMPALALTDHRWLTGAVEFYRACQSSGVRPILGLEVDLQRVQPGRGGSQNGPTHPLVLLAMDREGWSNLCRLSSALLAEDADGMPCPPSLLARCAGGLIALGGDQGDPTGRALEQLADLFPGRLYVELQRLAEADIPRSLDLARLARRLSLPVAAAHPVYALSPSQAPLLRTLAAIRNHVAVTELPAAPGLFSSLHFLPEAEMCARFADLPDALAATQEIAGRCQLVLPLGEPHYPRVDLPPGQTPAGLLRRKAEAGACRLYGKITAPIRARLDHELEVISERGFDPIFLIMEEIIAYARQTGVPISSRGSAASSLVAHCLGITSPDPLRLDLYFERFLNPARATPPDIDTDLCSRRREDVIRHVFETYGAQRVAMVGTINRFRPRSALGDAAKAYGLPPAQVRELVEALPDHFFRPREADGDEDAPAAASPFAGLAAAYPSPLYQHIFRDAEALLQQPRHLSVHAGGIVIAPFPLTDLVPVQVSGSKKVVITQLDLESVEQLGLIKLDLLGIRGLTVLGDVAEAVRSWRRSEFSTPQQVLDSIPVEDGETSRRIEQGQTIGCFQIESPGMRATLREIRARSIADLIVALALYRPGPLQGGLKDAFVRRFKGEEPVAHLHPALASLLGETYGVVIYQEQVLRIAHHLGGFSLVEADLLRRAMSHFDPGKQMQHLRQKFIGAAQQKSGVDPETGGRIWELMAAFAGYGFPKAHAASYAQVAWNSAWCKTHFPAEFMAAVLANWGGYYSQRVYLTEARRLGLPIRPPHVNHSSRDFSAVYPDGEPVLYMGLDQVRSLTRRTQGRILRGRPFASLSDFLVRVDPARQEAETLVRVGGLAGLGTIPGLLAQLTQGTWRLGQMPLFDWGTGGDADWTLEQRMAAQEELLGTSVDAHPLELFAGQIDSLGAISTVEASSRLGQQVCVAGVRQSWRRSRTSRGETMAFLSLEDLEGMLDVVLSPQVYRRARTVLAHQAPLLVTGTVEMDPARGEPLLHAEKVVLLG